MKVLVGYTEISNLASKCFRISLALRRVDEKLLEVSCKPKFFIPTVNMAFYIVAVRKDATCLSYDCSTFASTLIAGAARLLKNKIPNGIEIKSKEKRIYIYPILIDKRQKAHIALTGLSFGVEEISVAISLI